jgi:hypothetical protein
LARRYKSTPVPVPDTRPIVHALCAQIAAHLEALDAALDQMATVPSGTVLELD